MRNITTCLASYMNGLTATATYWPPPTVNPLHPLKSSPGASPASCRGRQRIGSCQHDYTLFFLSTVAFSSAAAMSQTSVTRTWKKIQRLPPSQDPDI